MRDLRLVAVSPQGSHLLLQDADEQQFRVRIDKRLMDAVRRDPARPGQLEIALESQLTPRDIQARIRAGHSAEEVADAAGVPVERIERYAWPVIAEREHVTEQAKAAPSRRASGGSAPTLGELVVTRLEEQKVAHDSVRWDSWRIDEGRWTVRLTYLAEGQERAAEWAFDPRGRVLSAVDEGARALVGEVAPEPPGSATGPIRRLSSVPQVGDIDPADVVYDHEADQADETGRADETDGADGADSADSAGGRATRPAPPARQVARAGRRPAVPSWDDIVFGARRRD